MKNIIKNVLFALASYCFCLYFYKWRISMCFQPMRSDLGMTCPFGLKSHIAVFTNMISLLQVAVVSSHADHLEDLSEIEYIDTN
uniref:Uncharacterized protein n=1 Tax=Ditylenchus dipsaci TaxID=166011 RepID=A0A915DNE5_9BILA